MPALSVTVNDVQIGLLELFDNYQQQFTFSEEYKKSLISSRPILGQIFEDRIPNPILVDGPICWFSHLLPQGVMRNWRCKILGIDTDDSFSLLEYLGADLPGAVVLTKTIAPLRKQSPPEPTSAKDDAEPMFKFSLAGVQWKLSARSSGRGLTTRATGDDKHYIAKFHSPEHTELPRREFATMNWAKQAGLVVPNFELRNIADFDEIPDQMPIGDGSVFVTQRFDREGKTRIHIEDFGQILDRPPGHAQYHGSYEELASVLRWIAPESLNEFLRLVVFNILCGNGDAHLKNFSIIYGPNGRDPQLAPAYDLVSTVLLTWKRRSVAETG